MSIIVHGGAWAIPDATAEGSKAGCEEAARIGYALLKEGKSAVEAVEAAVKSLENNPLFDAGYGSVLNAKGEIEMDAMIMEGRHLHCGSIAGVKSVQNPISLAKLVMDHSSHCLIVGEGAEQFAREMNVPEVSKNDLLTEAALDEYKHYLDHYTEAVTDLFNTKSSSSTTTTNMNEATKKAPPPPPPLLHSHETVGCVAIDLQGNVAAATSTGGITGKRVGRVGDSPLIGIGGYADNELGAVSCTGHGESIIRVTLARSVLYELAKTSLNRKQQQQQQQESSSSSCESESKQNQNQNQNEKQIPTTCGNNNAAYASRESVSDWVNQAAAWALDRMSYRTSGGSGGVVVVSPTGALGYAFNTPRMCWAAIAQDKDMDSGINE